MLFGHFVVSGRSMEPAFYAGDRLLVLNLNIFLKKGDVVVLRDPRDGRLVLKRIINVDESGYFVKGDNEKESTDSRTFGMIDRKDILGKVIRRYFKLTNS